jgi:excisionase family DNA binding protein
MAQMKRIATPKSTADYTTLEVARLLGMSVRSIQMMVDRGDLDAWKTPGGHRRIARASVQRWRSERHVGAAPDLDPAAIVAPTRRRGGTKAQACVLLIDDSLHFQKLVALLMRQHFPAVDLQVADDGIAGLALYGQLKPDVLVVDILLPGIDGATLITSLRSHAQFATSRLVVVTSLNERERAPYSFALEQVPVVHKPRLVAELPPLLAQWLPTKRAAGAHAAGRAR